MSRVLSFLADTASSIGGAFNRATGRSAEAESAPVLEVTPLSDYILRGKIQQLQEMIAKDPSMVNVCSGRDRQSPLHMACALGDATAVRVLLEAGAEESLLFLDKNGICPIHEACLNKHTDVVEVLLHYRTKEQLSVLSSSGKTALHFAAQGGSLGTAHALLSRGASLNPQDDYMETPLNVACSAGQCRMVEFLLSQSVQPEREVRHQNKFGRAPLHEAAWLHNYQLCMVLLHHGADPGVIHGNSMTPLKEARFSKNRHCPKVVQLLQDALEGRPLPEFEPEYQPGDELLPEAGEQAAAGHESPTAPPAPPSSSSSSSSAEPADLEERERALQERERAMQERELALQARERALQERMGGGDP